MARGYQQKLTPTEVEDIRRRARAGERHDALAAEFGVSRPYVSMLARGKKRQPGLHRTALRDAPAGAQITLSYPSDLVGLGTRERALLATLFEALVAYEREGKEDQPPSS